MEKDVSLDSDISLDTYDLEYAFHKLNLLGNQVAIMEEELALRKSEGGAIDYLVKRILAAKRERSELFIDIERVTAYHRAMENAVPKTKYLN